LMDWTGVCWQK